MSREGFFSSTQRTILSWSLTLLGLGVILLFLVAGVRIFGMILSTFSGLLWPLITASILTLLLKPVVSSLTKKLKLPTVAAVILLYLVLIAIGAGIAVLLLPVLISQIIDFIQLTPQLLSDLFGFFEDRLPETAATLRAYVSDWNFLAFLEDLIKEYEEVTAKTLDALQVIASQINSLFGFFIGIAIIPVYLFFFLQLKTDLLKEFDRNIPFLKEGQKEDLIFLIREFADILVAFFRGQFVIALIMAILLAVGFSLIGLKFGILLGLALGLLNIIPYLGTILGLLIALPIAFVQPDGGWVLALITFAIFAMVQNLESWVLTPKIMGERTGLHPVTIIIAVFFWGTALGGILGMIFAIPLTAFLITAWRLLKRKYLHMETPEGSVSPSNA